MSLVLDALRRVERREQHTGSVGVAVSSYRRPRRRTGFVPLLLGLIVGAAVVFLFGPDKLPRKALAPPPALSIDQMPAAQAPMRESVAPLSSPPRVAVASLPARPAAASIDSTLAAPAAPAKSASKGAGSRGAETPTPARTPTFVLQAISERDHHPIAIINDQLFREGEMLGTARVLRIGADSVEVLLANGKRDVIRFAPPPVPDSTPER